MKKRSELKFAVIGIGAFGSALAKKLSEQGAYVITQLSQLILEMSKYRINDCFT